MWQALRVVLSLGAVAALQGATAWAEGYRPPPASAGLLKSLDFARARPVDEDYRSQFVTCDSSNIFRGVRLSGHRRCSTDPNRLKALLKLSGGAIYWESKMGLDVDGSWAAGRKQPWKGADGNPVDSTDQCATWLKWRSPVSHNECDDLGAQVDPDIIPYMVIPMAGLPKVSGAAAHRLSLEFRNKTKLDRGDLGVIVFGGAWTPAIIADGGPFMKIGEASSRAFENLNQSRCRQWDAKGVHCVGPDGRLYPYKDYSIGRGVIFIAFPRSRPANLTADNAVSLACAEARAQLGLVGGKCPP